MHNRRAELQARLVRPGLPWEQQDERVAEDECRNPDQRHDGIAQRIHWAVTCRCGTRRLTHGGSLHELAHAMTSDACSAWRTQNLMLAARSHAGRIVAYMAA